MRKTFILLAASAMLLAACTKEESANGYTIQGNKITFGVGIDNILSEGKPVYRSEYGGVWFRGADQMLVNGVACGISPIASSNYPGSNNNRSPLASVTADISASGAYDFVYPADRFTVGASNQYNATFERYSTVPDYSNNCSIGTDDYDDANCLWPMYAGIANLANFHGNLRMLNACAFLSPRILYGPEWANVVFSPLSGVTYGDGDACPTMESDGRAGAIVSNQKLWGPAHLDYTNPLNPVMVMDEAVDAIGGRDSIVFNTSRSHTPTIHENISAQGGSNAGTTNIIGVIPIAPAERNGVKTFRVAIMLRILGFPCDVQGNTVGRDLFMMFISEERSTTSPINRNNQYLLDINLATASDYTYISNTGSDLTAEGYADAVVGSAGAKIMFDNGELLISSNANAFNRAILEYAGVR